MLLGQPCREARLWLAATSAEVISMRHNGAAGRARPRIAEPLSEAPYEFPDAAGCARLAGRGVGGRPTTQEPPPDAAAGRPRSATVKCIHSTCSSSRNVVSGCGSRLRGVGQAASCGWSAGRRRGVRHMRRSSRYERSPDRRPNRTAPTSLKVARPGELPERARSQPLGFLDGT